MQKLVLFDIDKTLTRGSKLHKKAISQAIEEVYGVKGRIEDIEYHGMTDKGIVYEILNRQGFSEEEIQPKIASFIKLMTKIYIKDVDKDEIILIDGAKDILKELKEHDVLLGLVTGNAKEIAYAKLKKVGLSSYFKFGGFGDDALDRSDLIKIALKRASDFNFKFNNNVFYIGDAVKDIKSGKIANVKTIGVTTGVYSKEELKRVGADFVFESLKDKDKILKVII
ncbi:MAG: HAD family hydrolase [archaeon]